MGSTINHHNDVYALDESLAAAKHLGMEDDEAEAWSMLTDLVEKFLSIHEVANIDYLPAPLQVHLSALQNHLMALPAMRQGDWLLARDKVQPVRRDVR